MTDRAGDPNAAGADTNPVQSHATPYVTRPEDVFAAMFLRADTACSFATASRQAAANAASWIVAWVRCSSWDFGKGRARLCR